MTTGWGDGMNGDTAGTLVLFPCDDSAAGKGLCVCGGRKQAAQIYPAGAAVPSNKILPFLKQIKPGA